MSPSWKRPNGPLNVWTDDDLEQGIAAGRRRLHIEEFGALADQHVAIQSPDPMESLLADEAHQKRMDSLHKGIDLLRAEQKRRTAIPRPIHQYPFSSNAEHLLFHHVHGWIAGRFEPGYWDEHHEYGREWNGAVFVLGDDLEQVEVEEITDDQGVRAYLCGEVTHFLPPVPAPPQPDVRTLDHDGLLDLLKTGHRLRPVGWNQSSILRDGFCYAYAHTFYEHTPKTVGVEVSPVTAGVSEALSKYGDQWEVLP